MWSNTSWNISSIIFHLFEMVWKGGHPLRQDSLLANMGSKIILERTTICHGTSKETFDGLTTWKHEFRLLFSIISIIITPYKDRYPCKLLLPFTNGLKKASSPEAPRQPGENPLLPSLALASWSYYCCVGVRPGHLAEWGSVGKSRFPGHFSYCKFSFIFSPKINKQNLVKHNLTPPKSA